MSNVLNKLHDIADKLKELEAHYAANNKEPLSEEEVKLIDVLNATINSLDDVEHGTVGSSFDDFLKEQGTYEATVDQAVTRIAANKKED
jgi:hypothetical protein